MENKETTQEIKTPLERYNEGVLIPFFEGLLKDVDLFEYPKANKSLIKVIHKKLLSLK